MILHKITHISHAISNIIMTMFVHSSSKNSHNFGACVSELPLRNK